MTQNSEVFPTVMRGYEPIEVDRRLAELTAAAENAEQQAAAESERELAAAIQRRDSINLQLADVRQMLTTLTGAGSTALAAQPAVPAKPPAGADVGRSRR